MSPEEQSLLSGLFERVRTAASTPRDREAETLIEQAIRAQPSAPYYLAQAVIVQEKGLEAAAQRIEVLEAQLRRTEERLHELESRREREPRDHAPSESASGGFLGSLFGSSEKPQPRPDANRSGEAYQPDRPAAGGPWGSAGSAPRTAYPASNPPYQPPYQAPPQASSGGGFLRGAMGTAAGVAGGMLLANSLSGIFGNHMSSLGLGGATETVAPIEQTTINNYYGDDAVTQASDATPDAAPDQNGAADNDGWEQADLDPSPNDDVDTDFSGDDTMDV